MLTMKTFKLVKIKRMATSAAVLEFIFSINTFKR
jgi:hypothetical protein